MVDVRTLRHAVGGRAARLFLVAVASVAVVAVSADAATVTPGTPKAVAAAVKAAVSLTKLPSSLEPTLGAASTDLATVATPSLAKCVTGGTNLTNACVFGDTRGSKTMVLWGDSHAEMWFPALNTIAKALHWKLVTLIELGCPVADLYVINPGTGVAYTNCQSFRQNMIARINAADPAVVVMSESWYPELSNGTDITTSMWRQALTTTLSSLTSKNTKKVLIGDTITVPDQDSCLSQHPTNIQLCDGNDSTIFQAQRAADAAAAAATRTLYVNEVPWECSTTCTEVVSHFVVYYSPGHLTAHYAQYLTTVLRDAIHTDL